MIEFVLCISVAQNLAYSFPVALEMKTACEKCGAALDAAGEAFICVYECTFCGGCADRMQRICPNCAGELVRRPRPKPPRARAWAARSL